MTRPNIGEFVQAAMDQVGLKYVGCSMPLWTPRGGNCDGLVEYAARCADIVLPFGSTDLKAHMSSGHHALTVIEASAIPGALIFDEDPRWERHVAISDGQGQVVEAVPEHGARIAPIVSATRRYWAFGVRIG